MLHVPILWAWPECMYNAHSDREESIQQQVFSRQNLPRGGEDASCVRDWDPYDTFTLCWLIPNLGQAAAAERPPLPNYTTSVDEASMFFSRGAMETDR